MLTQVLRALAPWLIKDAVIGAVLVGLVFWTVWSGCWLVLATARVGRAFEAATQALGPADPLEFASRYPAACATLSRNHRLGASWDGYSHSRSFLTSPPGR